MRTRCLKPGIFGRQTAVHVVGVFRSESSTFSTFTRGGKTQILPDTLVSYSTPAHCQEESQHISNPGLYAGRNAGHACWQHFLHGTSVAKNYIQAAPMPKLKPKTFCAMAPKPTEPRRYLSGMKDCRLWPRGYDNNCSKDGASGLADPRGCAFYVLEGWGEVEHPGLGL